MIINTKRLILNKREYLYLKRKAKALGIIIPDLKFGRFSDPNILYLARKYGVRYYNYLI